MKRRSEEIFFERYVGGEYLRVVKVSEATPPFRAYGVSHSQITTIMGFTYTELMDNIRRDKPEWAKEIDMAGA